AHPEREEQDGRERAIGKIVGRRQELERGVDRGGQRAGHRLVHPAELIAPRRRACPVKNADVARAGSVERVDTQGSADMPSGVGSRKGSPQPTATIYATAAATARRASTPMRWARYSALPWMSLAMPSAGTVMPSIDFGPKRFLSASSNDL